MDQAAKEKDIAFLFDISKEIKHMYETPIIFVLKKDYSENLFKAMCDVRTAISEDAKSRIVDIIVDLHLQWLHAVIEIENFEKRLSDLPKEDVYQAVSYTIDTMVYRLRCYQKYMERNKPLLPNQHQSNLTMELEIVEEMHKHNTMILLDKLKCFRNFSCQDEFQIKLREVVTDLLNWLDETNDDIAVLLSKYLNMNVPHLASDITKPLQNIVDDIQSTQPELYIEILNKLRTKGRTFAFLVRRITTYDLEISKVQERIGLLEDRIKFLRKEPKSPTYLMLKNKKEYLESILNSIKNSKTTLNEIHNKLTIAIEDTNDPSICSCEEFHRIRIFNHILPTEDKEQLITKLCFTWDSAIFGDQSHKSIISILSAVEMKEKFSDELGDYFIDEYSRKIYTLEEDDTLYQLNELHELVPLSDDAEHVYFYDECGRYYIETKTRQRIYKAHAVASEYVMDSSGVLLKIKEERDGVVYYYDNYGRYFINADGKHIYREEDAVSEYENDGLGNLVRIRSHLDLFDPCPADANVTEDFKYLKQNVGQALRECIADCIIHQPSDPIKYLSAALHKYRENIELKQHRALEQEALDIERQIILEEERAAAEKAAMEAALLAQGGSEASFDSNFVKYSTKMHPDGEPLADAK